MDCTHASTREKKKSCIVKRVALDEQKALQISNLWRKNLSIQPQLKEKLHGGVNVTSSGFQCLNAACADMNIQEGKK